ncbi:MAG: hypothetical protein QY325_04190 [Flavobacteriales bacterium]|nr:MAG: hypothetical protein QY325_04190 [Flavobacteriales bacterium]
MPVKTNHTAQSAATIGLWPKLAELYSVYQSAPGALRLDTERAPIRLEALMRLTDAGERTRLLDKYGWSLSAWRKWCARPVNLPAPLLGDIIAYWEHRTGETIPVAEVWMPLND